MSIAESYDSWAEQYDVNKNKTRDLDKKVTIETLRNYDFETVLELGCGTGKNTEWLVKNAEQIIGLDFSEEMLNKAKEKVTDPKVSFRKADLTKTWEIDNDFADLITVSLTLEHIKDLQHIFEQVRLKLRPNGLFFISELHPFKEYTGSKARFDTSEGRQKLEVYIHDVSEYINLAKESDLELIEMKEWRDENSESGLPRLITFLFKF